MSSSLIESNNSSNETSSTLDEIAVISEEHLEKKNAVSKTQTKPMKVDDLKKDENAAKEESQKDNSLDNAFISGEHLERNTVASKLQTKPMKADDLKKDENAVKEESEEDTCIICLEPGDLIHYCICEAKIHHACAVKYVSYPRMTSPTCCMCRQKLHYQIIDVNTPMEKKYKVIFAFIVLIYCSIVGFSGVIAHFLLPNFNFSSSALSTAFRVIALLNLAGFFPILFFMVLVSLCSFCSPESRRNIGSGYMCVGGNNADACCDCSCGGCGGCGGCDGCGCCDGCDDGCIIILGLIIVSLTLLILIAATIFLVMQLYSLYKCLALKSKKDIKFYRKTAPPKKPFKNISYEDKYPYRHRSSIEDGDLYSSRRERRRRDQYMKDYTAMHLEDDMFPDRRNRMYKNMYLDEFEMDIDRYMRYHPRFRFEDKDMPPLRREEKQRDRYVRNHRHKPGHSNYPEMRMSPLFHKKEPLDPFGWNICESKIRKPEPITSAPKARSPKMKYKIDHDKNTNNIPKAESSKLNREITFDDMDAHEKKMVDEASLNQKYKLNNLNSQDKNVDKARLKEFKRKCESIDLIDKDEDDSLAQAEKNPETSLHNIQR